MTQIFLLEQQLYNVISFLLVHSHSPEELQSSHSRVIRGIIGTSLELTQYDRLVMALKKDGPISRPREREMHDRILASLQTKVLASYNTLTSQQKHRERTTVQVLGTLPDSSEHRECLRKIKRCKALLRMWNIAF